MTALRVTDDIEIPEAELSWRFETSGGPGGQHANRSATRAVLSFDVAATSAIEESIRSELTARLADRLTAGVLTVSVDESRSQWRNRQIARRRLAEVLREALKPERPTRRPTRPGKAARRRRLEAKRRRAETKRLRRGPDLDDS